MGRDADLDRLSRNPGRFTDLKTQRATVLRGMTWRAIHERSPAEPGISRAIETGWQTNSTACTAPFAAAIRD